MYMAKSLLTNFVMESEEYDSRNLGKEYTIY